MKVNSLLSLQSSYNYTQFKDQVEPFLALFKFQDKNRDLTIEEIISFTKIVLTIISIPIYFFNDLYRQSNLELGALKILFKENMLTTENMITLLSLSKEESTYFCYNPMEKIAESFIYLQKLELLTESNRNLLVLAREFAYEVAKGLNKLHEANILTEENCLTISRAGRMSERVAECLCSLSKESILNEMTKTCLSKSLEDSQQLTKGFITLHKGKQLSTENCTLLAKAGSAAETMANTIILLCSLDLYNTTLYTLLSQNPILPNSFVEILTSLNQAHMLTSHNFIALWERITKQQKNLDASKDKQEKTDSEDTNKSISKELIKTLEFELKLLQRNGLLNENNFKAVLIVERNNDKFTRFHIATALISLNKVGLLNDANRELMIKISNAAPAVSDIFAILHACNLLTEDNRSKTLAESLHCSRIIKTFEILKNNNLLTQRNFTNLISVAEYGSSLESIFELITTVKNLRPLTQYKIDLLISKAKFASRISVCLSTGKHMAGFLNESNLYKIIANSEYCNDIAEAFNILFQENQHARKHVNKQTYFNQENVDIILSAPQYGKLIAEACIRLEDISRLNYQTRQILTDHPKYVKNISDAICMLHSRCKASIFEENVSIIALKPEHACTFSEAIVGLDKHDLLNAENRELLLNQIENSNQVAKAFITLNTYNLLNYYYKHKVLENQKYASNIAEGIEILGRKRILTSDCLDPLFRYPSKARENANKLAVTLPALNKIEFIEQTLLEKIIVLIVENDNIANIIYYLSEMNLLNIERIKLTLKHLQHVHQLSAAIKFLHEEQRSLYGKERNYTTSIISRMTENINSIFNNPPHAFSIAISFVAITYNSSTNLLESHQKILENPGSALLQLEHLGCLFASRHQFNRDFAKVRRISRLLGQAKRNSNPPFSLLPIEIIAKISSESIDSNIDKENITNIALDKFKKPFLK